MIHTFRAPILAVSLVALALASCGGGGGSVEGTIEGTVQFVAASTTSFQDLEPNGTVDQPQVLGEIAAGDAIEVRGRIGVDGDGFDAFALVAPERLSVVAELVFEATPARRIELALYDPVSMRLVERATGGRIAFDARGAFDLVVRGAEGFGAYGLRVRARPAPAATSRSGWLGDLSVGDQVQLRVAGERRWTATTAEAQSLAIRAPVGVSLTAQVGLDGPPVAIQGDGAEHVIECAALASLVIEARSTSPATLSLRSTAPAAGPRAAARLAGLERERADWNAPPGASLYGDPALEAMPGQVLVRARGAASLVDLLDRRGLRVREVLPGISTLVEADLAADLEPRERARTTVALARSLAQSARVEFAELNLVRKPLGGPITPNDTFFNLQWHYDLIRMRDAWGAYTGTNDVVVAVIDTGRRVHPDLDANTIAGFDFISDASIAADGNGRDSDETDVGDGVGPSPSSFHGTHVAGTIAAVTNNGSGVAGIASFPFGGVSRVKVKHLRVLGKGGGSDSDIAAAILYASGVPVSGVVTSTPVDVINLSLGGPGANSSVQSAINQARLAGVTVFAAAGNNNSGVAFFPAAFNNVVSVSAVDINSVKAPYSNFHASVDLCAPGGDVSVDLDQDGYPDGVLSTLVDEPAHDPVFAFYQGTSMACPHAAGVAALLLAQNANLSPAQVEAALKSTAVDLGAAGQDPIYGVGLIDAYQALLSVNGSGPATSPIIAVAPQSLAFGTDETQLTVLVQNVGTASMTVGTITDNASWLTTVPHVSSSSSTNVDSFAVLVDRSPGGVPLADGDYTATITVPVLNAVPPNPSSATVTVTMTVAPAIVFPSVQIYVLAIDANDYHTVAQAIVDPSVGLEYQIPDLPRGDYLLIAGSDDDPPGEELPDDVICGEEDTYCGGFPTLDELEVISISGGTIAGFDFVVGPNSFASTAALPLGRPIRLLR